LLAIFFSVLVWSGIAPKDRFTWWLEAMPAFIAFPLLLLTARRFPLTRLSYCLICLHALILFVGAHYTYAEVPAFDWLRDKYALGRNDYDKLGHFVQGFVPALIGRELLLRTSPLKPGKWLFVIIVLGCLGISAAYELVEWLVAVNTGTSADAFLGTQGDVWDTQKDMATAFIGAVAGLLTLSWAQNRELGMPRA
jgi:putative membrane protein